MLGLYIAYLCTKLDYYSFGHSRDIVGAHQNLSVSCDLTMPLSGMICHPWAIICYYQPAYQIWLRGSVVERRSLAGVLSLSCARPVADR